MLTVQLTKIQEIHLLFTKKLVMNNLKLYNMNSEMILPYI